MKRSEIFEGFVKIAQQRGLVSEAEHAEHTEKDPKNPRWDSLSVEQIGKLYDLKPDMPKDMEYTRNIIEDAHPDSVVLAPSYDKLNGLVENENEGQNIRLRIVMKEPDGHLTQRKYAEQQFLLSLVRVANDLDNRNQDELRKLADICLSQAAEKKNFEKVAFWPALIGAVAVLGGVLYAKQHLPFHSDGWTSDYEKAEKEINDLLTSNSNWGVGVDYTPEFIQTVTQLQSVLAEINTAVEKVMPALDEVQTPRTGEGITQEMATLAQQPETQSAAAAIKDLRAVLRNNSTFLKTIISDFGNPTYKQRSTAKKGFFTSVVDSTEVLHGGSALVADDFDDVAHAVLTLRTDLANIIKELRNGISAQRNLQQQLQAAQAEDTQMWEGQEGQAAKPPGSSDSVEGGFRGYLDKLNPFNFLSK